jgi:acetolactate synthase I/II/III large subunit
VPVTVSWRRHDLFSNRERLYAGHYSVFTPAPQRPVHEECDLLIAVGTRLEDLTTRHFTFPESPWPKRKLVHVYDDPAIIGRHSLPDVAAACDPALFLDTLAGKASGAPKVSRTAWIDRLAATQAAVSKWTPQRAADGVVFGNVVAALADKLEDDAIVTLDAGMCAALMYRYFPIHGHQRLIASIAAVMGWGVPAAVAAAMRMPGRRVVCVVGDGGFLMTGNELALAAERKLPLCIVLANNRNLGSIRQKQEMDFPGRPIATDLSTPDFVALAKAFGCTAFHIADENAVAATLDQALRTKGPVLVEIKTSLSAMLPAPARKVEDAQFSS